MARHRQSLKSLEGRWLAFLNTVRTERFNDVMCLMTRIPAIEAALAPLGANGGDTAALDSTLHRCTIRPL